MFFKENYNNTFNPDVLKYRFRRSEKKLILTVFIIMRGLTMRYPAKFGMLMPSETKANKNCL